MKHLNISDDAMKIILENSAWSQFGIKVDEDKKALTESTEDDVEELDEHVCPLCSSHLDEAISDEALMEHTANVLEAVNAATLNEEEEEDDGEELYEEADEDDEDEDDEDEDEDEDELVEEEGKPVKKKPKPSMPSLEDYIAKHGEREGPVLYKLHGGKKGK
jgi:hypothetical protein